MRTPELDKHWVGCQPNGGWYCMTCHFYTGQPDLHAGHKLYYLSKTEIQK